MPRHDEERVVDAHAETNHRRQDGRVVRHHDHVREQRQRAGAHRETEDRHHQGERSRDERPEGEEEDDERGEQTHQLADACRRLLEREEEVAAHLDPQRRGGGSLGAEGFQVLQVRRRELCLRRVLQPQQCYAPVRRHGAAAGRQTDSSSHFARGISGAQYVRQRSRLALELRQRGACLPGVRERCLVVEGRHHHLGGEARLVRPGLGHQVVGLLGVEARHAERGLELGAEGAGGPDHEDGDGYPGSDHRQRVAGCQPAESVQRAGHHQGLQFVGASAGADAGSAWCGGGSGSIGRRARSRPADGRTRSPFFRPIRWGCRLPTLGR